MSTKVSAPAKKKAIPKSSKSSKSSTPKPKPKARPVSTHPLFQDVVMGSIAALKNPNGSTHRTILKYIKSSYTVKEGCDTQVKRALLRLVESKKLLLVKGVWGPWRFKVNMAYEPEKKTVKLAARKTLAKQKSAKKIGSPEKTARKVTSKRTPKKAVLKTKEDKTKKDKPMSKMEDKTKKNKPIRKTKEDTTKMEKTKKEKTMEGKTKEDKTKEDKTKKDMAKTDKPTIKTSPEKQAEKLMKGITKAGGPKKTPAKK